MELVEPIKLTEYMIGERFMTREGKVVCLTEWDSSFRHSAFFSDTTFRTIDGEYYTTQPSGRDLIKHLPQSKYPEYYL